MVNNFAEQNEQRDNRNLSEYSESGRRLPERKRTWRVSRASGCVAACASTRDGDMPALVEAHETENIKLSILNVN